MVIKLSSLMFESVTIILVTILIVPRVESGIYSMMANAMGWNSGWESKGVTFGIKSKGMTAIIPIPLPIPIFSKEKKKEDSGSSGGSSGGGNMKGGSSSGGWEMPAGGSDWWK